MEYRVTRSDAKNELYHYGVKGMKWGVRKSPEYKEYKKRRRKLTTTAGENGRWDMAYNASAKREQKRLDKRIQKEMNKSGKVSDKTKDRINAYSQLKRDAATVRQYKNTSLENLQKYVNESAKKLGKANVKDVKTYTIKGEKYARTFIFDNAVYSVERRKTTDQNGNTRSTWVPVKTRYYYY